MLGIPLDQLDSRFAPFFPTFDGLLGGARRAAVYLLVYRGKAYYCGETRWPAHRWHDYLIGRNISNPRLAAWLGKIDRNELEFAVIYEELLSPGWDEFAQKIRLWQMETMFIRAYGKHLFNVETDTLTAGVRKYRQRMAAQERWQPPRPRPPEGDGLVWMLVMAAFIGAVILYAA